jgi:hypothetical protein
MASRNRALVGSVDPILTTFATGYKNGKLIGDIVAPRVTSLTESGTFMSLDKAGFKLYDTERAIRTRPGKIDHFPTSGTYICAEHSLSTALDVLKEIKVAESYGANEVLKLKQRGIMLLNQALATTREKAIADVIMGTSYYDAGNRVALTGNDCWSDKSNSDPLGQIATGKTTARADMGLEPNTLVLGWASWQALKNHPAMLAKIKNSKNQFLTIEDAKEILDIEQIVVGPAVYATDAGVFTDLWTDNAALIYLPAEGELPEGVPVHTIQIFEIGYPVVSSEQDEMLWEASLFEKYAVKNISDVNGYLISNTVA